MKGCCCLLDICIVWSGTICQDISLEELNDLFTIFASVKLETSSAL